MYKTKLFFMKDRPTIQELAQRDLSKKAETVFLASFEDARREQNLLLKKARAIERKSS